MEALTGNLIEAENNFQKVIEINPVFVEAYVNLGEIKIDLNKINEAESLFLKSIRINPDFAYGNSSLLRLYEKTNNLEKLKEKLDFISGNNKIKNEILMYRSRVFFREKDFIKAKELINKVSLNWVQNTDQNTRINFWSFKAFIEEKSNFQEVYESFNKSQENIKYENCNKDILSFM